MVKWKDVPIGAEFAKVGEQDFAERVAGTTYPWKKVNANQAVYVGRPNASMRPGEYKWFDLDSWLMVKP